MFAFRLGQDKKYLKVHVIEAEGTVDEEGQLCDNSGGAQQCEMYVKISVGGDTFKTLQHSRRKDRFTFDETLYSKHKHPITQQVKLELWDKDSVILLEGRDDRMAEWNVQYPDEFDREILFERNYPHKSKNQWNRVKAKFEWVDKKE